MKIVQKLCLLCVSLTLLMLCSCSSSEDSEKDTIKMKTDKVAQEAIDHIKTPIDQAEKAVEAANKTIKESFPEGTKE